MINEFFIEWERMTTPTESALLNKTARRFNDMHVVLSRSGRDNTVRINYMKSTRKKSGEMKKFLKWITAQATANEFALSMAVQPCSSHYEEAVSKEKLREVATRYGFVVQHEYPDSVGYEMRRELKK
jgi:hypothetical protein